MKMEEVLQLVDDLSEAELEFAREFNLAKTLDQNKSDKKCEMEAIQSTNNKKNLLKYRWEAVKASFMINKKNYGEES